FKNSKLSKRSYFTWDYTHNHIEKYNHLGKPVDAVSPITGDRLFKDDIFLNDPGSPIEYDPVFREYYFRLDNQSQIITFAFCPWCGSKLPKELREELFNALKMACGREPQKASFCGW
ncbi:4556_t:CDS:2, partial [Ambispora leptoticha]